MYSVSENAPLNQLSNEQVRKLYEDVYAEITELRELWFAIGNLMDPQYDEDILKIFARLDHLEYELLPRIEKRLQQPRRIVTRAA